MQEEHVLEIAEVARQAVEAASEKQADNIVMLDTRQICSFADFFVICSAESERQIDAIREEIQKTFKEHGYYVHHVEGTSASGWVLMDMGGIIIHIFSRQQRDYYKLDELWLKAIPVLRIQ